MMALPIDLMDATTTVSLSMVLARHDGPIVACDFYIDGAEEGDDVPGGYEVGRVLNVDHHAPLPRMTRQISSTNLALERLAANGAPPLDTLVVINHADCDSVLSAGVMSGRLEPDSALGAAAIAADHTGEPDPIADLLQPLDRLRDIELSFRSLLALRDGRPLEREAAAALAARLVRREQAAEAVARREFVAMGHVALGIFTGEVDGEFFPALLPDAVVILLASPRAEDSGRWTMKVRLGVGAPPGFTLPKLTLSDFDLNFGGRWNAGANRRGGGTSIAPEIYAAEVARRVEALLPTRTSRQ